MPPTPSRFECMSLIASHTLTQDGRRSMTNRIADDMLEGLHSTYYYPVPYWRMGEGEREQTVTVGGSA